MTEGTQTRRREDGKSRRLSERSGSCTDKPDTRVVRESRPRREGRENSSHTFTEVYCKTRVRPPRVRWSYRGRPIRLFTGRYGLLLI
uniref:Uncharacterized protein n=1 Tax=Scophthalmus maximus TaxID=52904 RepID=A0A8D3D9P2_SCOMX